MQGSSCSPSIALRRIPRRDRDLDLPEALFEDGVTEVDSITALVGRRPHQTLAETLLKRYL